MLFYLRRLVPIPFLNGHRLHRELRSLLPFPKASCPHPFRRYDIIEGYYKLVPQVNIQNCKVHQFSPRRRLFLCIQFLLFWWPLWKVVNWSLSSPIPLRAICLYIKCQWAGRALLEIISIWLLLTFKCLKLTSCFNSNLPISHINNYKWSTIFSTLSFTFHSYAVHSYIHVLQSFFVAFVLFFSAFTAVYC